MGRKSRSAFAVGVFALSALVTYNVAAMAHGHSTASSLGHHMDSHIGHLEDKHDAFSFEPHVVARAGDRRPGDVHHAVKGARVGLKGHGHGGVSGHHRRRDDRGTSGTSEEGRRDSRARKRRSPTLERSSRGAKRGTRVVARRKKDARRPKASSTFCSRRTMRRTSGGRAA
jgi:hypothetical protein